MGLLEYVKNILPVIEKVKIIDVIHKMCFMNKAAL